MSTINKTLFVSAFYSNINNRYKNTIKVYLENAKNVLQDTRLDKIIFTDVSTYNQIAAVATDIDMSAFHIAPPFDSNLILHIDPVIMSQSVKTQNPDKDTMQYMLLMCNKTEFMRTAIHIKGNYNQYVWFDFGLNYILHTPLSHYLHRINEAAMAPAAAEHHKVRIGHIWPLADINTKSCATSICWYFAGGLFGSCSKTQILMFADLMKACVYEFIITKKYIVWEVNLWALIYKNHPDIFSPYGCNHNDSIVNNFI